MNIKKISTNFLLILFSTYLSLYLIEIFLFYNLKNTKYILDTPKYFDKRSLKKFYIDNNKKFYPELSLNSDDIQKYWFKYDNQNYYPLSLISNSIFFAENESGEYSKFKTDHLGFVNNKKDFLRENKVILIGDSFTRGCCVEKGFKFFFDQLDFPAYNIGISGNGPLSNYAAYKEYGNKITSEYAFYFHFEGNDLTDLKKELGMNLINNYLDKDFKIGLEKFNEDKDKKLINIINQIFLTSNSPDYITKKNPFYNNYVNQKKAYDYLASFKWPDLFYLHLLRNTIRPGWAKKYISLSKKLKINKKKTYDYELINNLKKIFLNLKIETEANKHKLVVIHIPDFSRYDRININSEYIGDLELIEEISKELDITTILLNEFIKEINPMSLYHFNSYSHYTEKGYEFLSKKIINSLN